VERQNLYVSLVPGVEQPQSVEPPPLNVQWCYVDIEDDHKAGARAEAEKSLVATGQSKKRAGSPQEDKAPEDSTRKHRRMVQDWSEDEEDEDASFYMLTRKRRSEHTTQGGSTPLAKGPHRQVSNGREGTKRMPNIRPTTIRWDQVATLLPFLSGKSRARAN
jgi:hypothetical protein